MQVETHEVTDLGFVPISGQPGELVRCRVVSEVSSGQHMQLWKGGGLYYSVEESAQQFRELWINSIGGTGDPFKMPCLGHVYRVGNHWEPFLYGRDGQPYRLLTSYEWLGNAYEQVLPPPPPDERGWVRGPSGLWRADLPRLTWEADDGNDVLSRVQGGQL